MSHPALEQLVRAYLTQDWPFDYAEPLDAVDDFVRAEPGGRDLPGELADLLASGVSEDDLSDLLLNSWGLGYLPEADGLSMREWLTQVRERALAQLGTTTDDS